RGSSELWGMGIPKPAGQAPAFFVARAGNGPPWLQLKEILRIDNSNTAFAGRTAVLKAKTSRVYGRSGSLKRVCGR
ncbi:hypothetical protein, partial [Bacillus amyloliquefaciens]|uniref:hypothetical protein n=1 Tax=Bacillus amyloliquefaciens TaxID=1390 RepID=UPI001CD60732